jgi:uncharacterized paraquat-inducible protein A
VKRDRCFVCRRPAPVAGSLHLDDEAGELVLCPACAEVAFPGLRESTSSQCPHCRAASEANCGN